MVYILLSRCLGLYYTRDVISFVTFCVGRTHCAPSFAFLINAYGKVMRTVYPTHHMTYLHNERLKMNVKVWHLSCRIVRVLCAFLHTGFLFAQAQINCFFLDISTCWQGVTHLSYLYDIIRRVSPVHLIYYILKI